MSDIWDLPKDEQIVVKVNAHLISVGEAACKLTRFFGAIVRTADYAPVTYTTWSKMPTNKKEEIWKEIKSKFAFHKLDSEEFVDEDTLELIKTWALEDVCGKWRAWKNELKSKYYDEDKTPEQMFDDVTDSRVDKTHFLTLAAHWNTDKPKEQSAKNRENRSKLDQPHCAGTKSFPRLIQDMTEEANGVQPSRAEVYVRSRTRKSGGIVNDKASDVVGRIQQVLSESNEDSQNCSWQDYVLSKVIGPEKKGRVRCSGVKLTSSNKSGSSSPSSSHSLHQNPEVKGLQNQVQGLQTALNYVLSFIQRQFPNENEEILTNMNRVVNGEAVDAVSAPEISPNRNNPSSESTHQPSPNGDS